MTRVTALADPIEVRRYGITWSDMPVCVDLVNPYLVGLLPKYAS